MAVTDISLCSQALVSLGCSAISGFADGTAEATVAANLYPGLRDAALSSHPWRFAQARVRLARLAAEPTADYAYAYALPTGFLRALSAGPDGSRGIDYRLAEGRLETDSDVVMLSYVFRPAEAVFPPFFQALLIKRLAAEFCIPLTESTSRAELFHQLAETEWRRAKTMDSQQDTPAAFDDFSLLTVRG